MSGNIITIAEGAGGERMDSLIKNYILKHLYIEDDSEVGLKDLDDSAVINDIVFSTDSHTVEPLFFPGGDIGKLAVCGTINDISVLGAKPIALSSAFIIEEGFGKDEFDKILESMREVSVKSGVPIVTGDTKVVEKGGIKGIAINTSGIGIRTVSLDKNLEEAERYRKVKSRWLTDSNLAPGDVIIVSGRIAEHGIALLSFREGYGFESKIKSDVAPLNDLMDTILREGGVVSAKDPTRGGIANALNELSEKSGVMIEVWEEKIPISDAVRSACEMLGLDPLEIGNEGKVVVGVVKEKAEDILDAMKRHPLGKDAEIIGEVKGGRGVFMETVVGGRRRIPKPIGDPIPRIC